MGLMTQERQTLLAQMDSIDPHSNVGTAALLGHLKSSKAWERLVALKLLAASRHPNAPEAVLSVAFDPHPRIVDEVTSWLRDLESSKLSDYWDKYTQDPKSPIFRLWNYFVPADKADKLKRLLRSENPEIVLTMLTHCPPANVLESHRAQASSHPLADFAVQSCLGKQALALAEGDVETLWQRSRDLEIAHYWLAKLCVASGSQVGVQLAKLMATHKNADSSLLAARAMCGDKEALNLLTKQLDSKNIDRRISALIAFSQIARTQKLSASNALLAGLGRLMSHADQWVRLGAATLAGRLNDLSLNLSLISRFKDNSAQVRAAAAYSLGQLKSNDAVSVLIEIGIDDSDKVVRDMSFAALHRIVHNLVMPPPRMVSEWLSGDDPNAEKFWGRDREKWRHWYQVER
ncbi:MAG TPA: HEAT repeat domain-containing protein [Myxococcales bacterium]|nr:HEAT repeat domain-containing protein [Myxococcales bacterium]